MTSPVRVKFLSRVTLPDGNVGSDYLRRFPHREPIWGNCRFIFERECRDYDWLVVYDDLPGDSPVEPLACPSENTLFITGEPSSITHYVKRFLSQFGHVLTGQEPWALQHPGVIRRQPGLLWYYGGPDERGTFDSLIATPPPQKTKPISTVCSDKAMKHTLHSQRLAFTKHLMQDLPDLDVFGYGMGHLDNKADAIDPYRYHLVIENHSCPHHWTEKLADAFLGYSLPIYFGCTNPDEYFPEDSYVWIDIRNYGESLARIRSILHEDAYEKRLTAIIEARNRVLTAYGTFPQLARLIEERHHAALSGGHGETIRSRHGSRMRNPLGWPAEGLAKLKLKTRHLWSSPMKFSVLVNNYNYARFLPEMLASVVGQTLPPHEIIVVDDGSTDDSLQVLEALAAATPNLIVHAQSNAGQFSAMRAGMRLATGDWCLFLDADDVWEPDHIHHAALAAAASPGAAIWYAGHRETEGPPLYRSKWPAGAIGPCAALVSATGVRIGTITSAIGIRRDIMDEILGLPASLDADWRIRADDVLLFAGALAGAVIHYSPEPSVRYRIHGSNQFANRKEDVAAYEERKRRLFDTCRKNHGIDPSRHLPLLCAELRGMPPERQCPEILRRYRRAIRRTDDSLIDRLGGYLSTFGRDRMSGP